MTESNEHIEKPVIGVIGATFPTKDYDRDVAIELGYKTREWLGDRGSLFTGGVYGVGLDFYEGVVNFCEENNVDDRFFILYPEYETEEFAPPEKYFELARRTPNQNLRVITRGFDMVERRIHLARIADYTFLLNGGRGTLDEFAKIVKREKPVIVLRGSGGLAGLLDEMDSSDKTLFPRLTYFADTPYDAIQKLDSLVTQ